MNLNRAAGNVCRQMIQTSGRLRVAMHAEADGSRIIDCGVAAAGGLEAGRMLSLAAMAGLGCIDFHASHRTWPWPSVTVRTDHPLAACMASQYAGWQISVDDYFAMGSGPMRALARKEALFEQLGYEEEGSVAVGVLESAKLPTREVCRYLSSACRVEPANLTLLVAPTASQAGTIQIVARSVETAMHKLHELDYDLRLVQSGFGTAPLPPVARTDLEAMGRTNDAILYGAEVTLWVRMDDQMLQAVGPRVPSQASDEHGKPFLHVFERYGRDFYKIDPGLFAPAVVNFVNLQTGNSFRFGRLMPDVLEASFGGRT